ncbi:MAG: YicC/YloC family endoribonuclease [Brevinemataceae bacterium]
MIRGMTGHAVKSFSTDTFDAEMEIKSVNSKYFEFRVKLPNKYNFLEIDIRKIVSQRLIRGKIDLYLRISEKQFNPAQICINRDLAKLYVEEGRRLADELNLQPNISIKDILTLPHILNIESSDSEELFSSTILQELESLIDSMLPMMITEGESTVKDILNSISLMEESVTTIQTRYPQVLEKYKKLLIERVSEISVMKTPEERLMIEIELFASRTAINEELVRLVNHIFVMKNILLDHHSNKTSKDLDFIAQEMNREANTIASKSSDIFITEHTIVLKSEIEKMREQFRNII